MSTYPLPIRTDPTDSEASAGVHCPLRHQTITLDECVRCEHCAGLRIDGGEAQALLICRVESESMRARMSSSPPGGGASADHTTLADVMTRDVVCVRPDTDLGAVTALFLERHISGAPVIGDDGTPVGIISKTDLLRELHERMQHGKSTAAGAARDIMMPISFVLPQNETLSRAAALMAFEGVHRILVLAPNGTVGGLVSSLDVLRWLARRDGYVLGS